MRFNVLILADILDKLPKIRWITGGTLQLAERKVNLLFVIVTFISTEPFACPTLVVLNVSVGLYALDHAAVQIRVSTVQCTDTAILR